MLFVNVFFKILNSYNAKHQVGPNCNFIQNFSSLALKGDAVGVVPISAGYGSGT
jgi:hypothetical protein